jgi:hypothetical protein
MYSHIFFTTGFFSSLHSITHSTQEISQMELSHQLHSQQKVDLLNEIDQLRSQGVSQFVHLPQLIVCGDQSSGKSSVLEEISSIPFPTKENLCIRLATEVILRNAAEETIYVSIVPDQEKSPEERGDQPEFQHTLSSFEHFGELIEAAHEFMSKTNGTKAFYKDILQLKLSGPTQPHLTIVDLPGLIHSESKQQSQADVQTVREMVSQYMEQPRSVILAVVSAKNDYVNQIVLSLARNFDPHGARTMGVITKPDELRPGSESEKVFLELAENKDIHFRLGWHVLRNRDYNERKSSREERDGAERVFFQAGKWRMFPSENVGIDALRPKLSDVLFEQIKLQLPNLVSDIQTEINSCKATLSRLGPSRATSEDQRRFLLTLSEQFQRLVRAALSGAYEDQFFEDPSSENGKKRRIRAVVQNSNIAFAATMKSKGQQREIVLDHHKASKGNVRRADFIEEIRVLLRATSGCELPGMFRPLIVTDLFRQHSEPWEGLAKSHISQIFTTTEAFLKDVVASIADELTSEALLSHVIYPKMKARESTMLKSLMRSCSLSNLDIP